MRHPPFGQGSRCPPLWTDEGTRPLPTRHLFILLPPFFSGPPNRTISRPGSLTGELWMDGGGTEAFFQPMLCNVLRPPPGVSFFILSCRPPACVFCSFAFGCPRVLFLFPSFSTLRSLPVRMRSRPQPSRPPTRTCWFFTRVLPLTLCLKVRRILPLSRHLEAGPVHAPRPFANSGPAPLTPGPCLSFFTPVKFAFVFRFPAARTTLFPFPAVGDLSFLPLRFCWFSMG